MLFHRYKEKNPKYIIILLIIIILFPVIESVFVWREHPKKIVCGKESDECKLITYSYEHKICWDTLPLGRHHHVSCKLPKRQVSESELFKLSKISEVKVGFKDRFFVVNIVNSKGKEEAIAHYKNNDRASYMAGQIGARIKHWQTSENGGDVYGIRTEHNFDFDFVDDEQ